MGSEEEASRGRASVSLHIYLQVSSFEGEKSGDSLTPRIEGFATRYLLFRGS